MTKIISLNGWALPQQPTEQGSEVVETMEDGEQFVHPRLAVFANAKCNKPLFIGNGEQIEEFIRLNDEKLKALCERKQKGDDKAKQELAAVMPMGMMVDETQPRSKQNCTPSGLGMMDIDHIKGDPREVWKDLMEVKAQENYYLLDDESICEVDGNIRLVHVTPSGKGLRIIFVVNEKGLEASWKKIDEKWGFSQYGDIDECCRDLSRLSFLVPQEYILCGRWEAMTDWEIPMKSVEAMKQSVAAKSVAAKSVAKASGSQVSVAEEGKYRDYEVKGRKVADVAQGLACRKWGADGPQLGTRHIAYCELARIIAPMCECKAEILVDVLPPLDPDATYADRRNACQFYCTGNAATKYDKELQAYLDELEEDEREEQQEEQGGELMMPKRFAPIIDEYLASAPSYMRMPLVFTLASILGAKATNFYAIDPFDPEEEKQLRTIFLTALVAPLSSGKAQLTRIKDRLMRRESMLDELTAARYELYNRDLHTKSQKQARPQRPQLCYRLGAEKTSVPSLLSNCAYSENRHVLYYTDEISTLVNNLDKDDDMSTLLRKAFDNEVMKKQHWSEDAFSGAARLCLNICATGTPLAVGSLAKTPSQIENGTLSRFCFAPFDLEGRDMEPFKPLTKEGKERIEKTLKRIEEQTYEFLPTMTADELMQCKSGAEADEKQYRAVYKPMKEVNIDFINPLIDKWLKEKGQLARETGNRAMEQFRYRVGDRGRRFALLLAVLHGKVDKRVKETIEQAVQWWLATDLQNILQLWGDRFNAICEQTALKAVKHYPNLFVELADEFTKADVEAVAQRLNVPNEARKIVSRWSTTGMVVSVGKNVWRKADSKKKAS